MSSIIDDLLFSRWREPNRQPLVNLQKQNQEALDKICKKIYLSSEAAVLSSTPNAIELSNKHIVQDQQYAVRMRLERRGRSWRVEAHLLQNSVYKKISSKQNEILLLKKISNYQCQNPKESTIYVHLGNIVMVHEFFICVGEGLDQHKLSDFYNVVLQRNLSEFNHFVGKCDGPNPLVVPQGPDKTMAEDLLLSQVLSTTTNSLGLTEQSAQFKSAQRLLQQKKQDLRRLRTNLIEEAYLQKTSRNYNVVNQLATASWIKNNFEQSQMSNQKRFAGLLSQSKFAGNKKIDDYIFNTVKVAIRQTVPKPVNEGGSCLIYLAKAAITFISSVDSSVYVQNEDRKERLIAIKKLKPEYEKKFAHKLLHEKQIVTKLKGGCSYFIPKYYREQTQKDAQDSLMMEYIQGEQLDYFVMIRNETISLWSKIFVLLNMVHGLRHLNTYGIVHLDLKPINVLVCRQQTTKIIDYGEAYHQEVCSRNPNYSPGYTFPYVSPEVLTFIEQSHDQKEPVDYSEKQDVFAFGMIMAELIFNSKAFFFNHSKYKEVYTRKQVLERYLLSPERLQFYGDKRVMPTLGHLILRCLDMNPSRRPKFDWIAVTLKLILSSCSV